MRLTRCKHGHFYDGDKYPQCPHCHNKNMGQEDSVTMPGTVYRKNPDIDMGAGVGQEDSVTVPVSAYQEDSVTVPLRQAAQEAIKSAAEQEEDGKTVSFYQSKRGIDPVAGWLVCIEGEDFGGSFTIKSGRNFVGRSADMDIVLHGDNSISRVKHAVILYEPRRREFIAQAGESRELFYLNDEVVLNPVRLKQHDILTIGNTRLMFFPCCGEKFSWDDYQKSER